jgi:tripartite ATP-independent transporter DctP family solute receptor
MNRILMAVVIFIMGAALAGCGSKAPDAKSPANPNSSNNPSTSAAPAAQNGEKAKFTIRLGASQPADHPMTTAMNKFKELVEKESNGQIKVQVYPANQLGSQVEMNEGVKSGTVTMTYSSIAYIGGNFDPNYNAFLMPFLVTKDNINKAYAALDGESGSQLSKEMEAVGIKPLGYGPIGFRHITNSKHAIKSPADLNGIKIRLQPNNVQIDTFKALGANPTAMDFSEVYSGLQQKVVDGQENPIDIIFTNKFQEVQKYLTLSGHFYDYAGLWMNKKYFDALPQDLQKVVTDSGQKMVQFHRELYVQKEADYLAKLKQAGMEVYEPTAAEIAQFKEKSKSVYDKYLNETKDKAFAQKMWDAVTK